MRGQNHKQGSGGDSRQSWFMELQGLDDAIAYRMTRLALPCRDCDEAEDRCDDHACDVVLLSGYQQRVEALFEQEANADSSKTPATAAGSSRD